jgi:hypothetical protein
MVRSATMTAPSRFGRLSDQPDGTVQVMRVAYNKLVRDQIPGIIAADGCQPVTRVLDPADYEAGLRSSASARHAQATARESCSLSEPDHLPGLPAVAGQQ